MPLPVPLLVCELPGPGTNPGPCPGPLPGCLLAGFPWPASAVFTVAPVPSEVDAVGRPGEFANGIGVGPSGACKSERDITRAAVACVTCFDVVSGMCGAGSWARTTTGEVVLGGSVANVVEKFVDDIFRFEGISSLFGGSIEGSSLAIIAFCSGAGVIVLTGILGGDQRSSSGTGVGRWRRMSGGASG